MKKNRVLIVMLLVAATLVSMLAGCGKTKEEAPAVSGDDILQMLLNHVQYATPLEKSGEEAALFFPGLPEGSTIVRYAGTGYFADEVVCVTMPDGTDSQKVLDVFASHVKDLHNQFMNYIPEELDKIDSNVTFVQEPYAFLCITSDSKTVNNIFDNPADFKEKFGSETVAPAPSEDPAASVPQNTTVPEETTTEPETTVPPVTEAPVTGNYPVLTSKSGTYVDYGSNYCIRVDNSAFELYGYIDSSATTYASLVSKTADALAGKVNVYSLPIPTAIAILLPDDLHADFKTATHQGEDIKTLLSKMSSNVIPVNVYDNMMQHRDEYLYFRTDYHWNGPGAYYAYEHFCNVKGVTPYTLSERTEKQFPDYLGYLYWNNAGKDPVLADTPDTVHAYLPKSPNVTMKFTDQRGNVLDWPVIMDVSGWASDSKYNTFAAGDNPFTEFTNPDVTDGSVCVIVKDSYGNALLPFLADHYSKIYEIDFRYWTGNLTAFAQENGATDLIFANNMSMIGNDYLIGKLAGIVG